MPIFSSISQSVNEPKLTLMLLLKCFSNIHFGLESGLNRKLQLHLLKVTKLKFITKLERENCKQKYSLIFSACFSPLSMHMPLVSEQNFAKIFKRLHLVKTTSWQHRSLDLTNLAPMWLRTYEYMKNTLLQRVKNGRAKK